MNITDYIPVGRENAVSRDTLCRLTGLCDRDNRELISIAQQSKVILNDGLGQGYYRPRPEDVDAVARQRRRENARMKSMKKKDKPMQEFLRAAGREV